MPQVSFVTLMLNVSNVHPLCLSEPMKESILSRVEKREYNRNKREYKQGAMLNKTKILLDEFYRPHLKQLTQLLGDDKWMWGH